ncbi:hypothetical protein AGABI1DRAFT_83752 [Agaricus bisporus var. burnettii JB137-S8]|uniref:YCII-related domain-containing protein n=1 Tax=Agaricus bisporus var. burnettii (strain JB137-S8 / ATCC MYA-4627 / FGSC 10392) TaxID=597362 RepID=K5XCG0_AGABU|nr:uncharacterized protein AGABI1DRAFT_83752 [Agaricus bisporus var. burnettii JB137-S8]EKM80792.1 hypothetical protein AGABI1DRAFT_83752 [Agaricus bisporus var. burnettii JB137-S8]
MSTSTTPKKKFCVYAPDYPNNLARRFEVREAHLADVKPHINSGVFRVAGIVADPDKPTTTIDGQTRPNAQGSLLIVEADTLEEVKKLIMNDVYWKNGVWDKEKVVIQPFLPATPFP